SVERATASLPRSPIGARFGWDRGPQSARPARSPCPIDPPLAARLTRRLTQAIDLRAIILRGRARRLRSLSPKGEGLSEPELKLRPPLTGRAESPLGLAEGTPRGPAPPPPGGRGHLQDG